jgi:hypothetical protein
MFDILYKILTLMNQTFNDLRYVFFFLILLVSCSSPTLKNQKQFPVPDITDEAWADYEGRWKTEDGVVQVELSLKSGAFGIDSYYKLHQRYLTDGRASGTGEYDRYSTYADQASTELKLCLHNLHDWDKNFLRYKLTNGVTESYEMYFITRGK